MRFYRLLPCARVRRLQWELSSHVLSVLETEIFPGTRHVRHITNISPRSQLGGPYASERITQELGHNRTSILDATLERRRPPSSLFPSNIVGENIQRLFHSYSVAFSIPPPLPYLSFTLSPSDSRVLRNPVTLPSLQRIRDGKLPPGRRPRLFPCRSPSRAFVQVAEARCLSSLAHLPKLERRSTSFASVYRVCSDSFIYDAHRHPSKHSRCKQFIYRSTVRARRALPLFFSLSFCFSLRRASRENVPSRTMRLLKNTRRVSAPF